MKVYRDNFESMGFREYGILTIEGGLFQDHDCPREKEEFNLKNMLDPWENDFKIQTAFFNSYVLPLINKLEGLLGRKLGKILSAGCGTGVEVEGEGVVRQVPRSGQFIVLARHCTGN